MNDQLENRLRELKAEYEAGQKALAELESKQANLQTTLLRINGAIQELESELGVLKTDVSATGPTKYPGTKRKSPP